MPEQLDYTFLKEVIDGYLKAIKDIKFAEIELESLIEDPRTPEEITENIVQIINTAKELNQIIEQSPSSIYVANSEGKTLRMNKSFEDMSEIDRSVLMGKNTHAIEEEGVFNPSICSLALQEKRRVVVQQKVNDHVDFITTGVPVLNEHGEIFRVTTNALLNEDLRNINTYFSENNNRQVDSNTYSNNMIAESDKMKKVIQLADLIKDTDSTILIEGETGVGKSLLARYIHATGRRKNKKMMEINCGAIPPALLESELFGYVSGAFTGADKKGKPGLIELCDGGTILLDEIGDMPLHLQVKLLHFLQNRKITRIGGTKEISINVRVIAATNANLKKLVEEGKFREDLYYRLNIIPITIPPLRERTADIPSAVKWFMLKYTTLYGRNCSLDDQCIERIKRFDWPGNLRELENYIERFVATNGETITIVDESSAPHKAEDPAQTIHDMERDMILQAYRELGSSYKVAKKLGISQSTASRKLRKYLQEQAK